MKYSSPLKYTLELLLKQEFDDSVEGQKYIIELDYTIGVVECRLALLAFVLGARILAFTAFYIKARSFI